MSGYSKNIAVLKGVRGGFSADGRQLSGLVKAERYGGFLRVEITPINFAPLLSGRYVAAISDGAGEQLFEGSLFEGESEVDTSCGYAAVICFCVGGEVKKVAQAVCGDFEYAVEYAVRAVELAENGDKEGYDDEAIAEDNYFGYGKQDKTYEDGKDMCTGEGESGEKGSGAQENDVDSGVCAGEKQAEQTDGSGQGEDAQNSRKIDGVQNERQELSGGLCEDIGFYEQMKEEIDKLFAVYPREEELERTLKDSEWIKITYGSGKFYVFGIINTGGKPRYLCYGVPSDDAKNPPCSLKGMAGYIPVKSGGYWVMYQDALTGASIRIECD